MTRYEHDELLRLKAAPVPVAPGYCCVGCCSHQLLHILSALKKRACGHRAAHAQLLQSPQRYI